MGEELFSENLYTTYSNSVKEYRLLGDSINYEKATAIYVDEYDNPIKVRYYPRYDEFKSGDYMRLYPGKKGVLKNLIKGLTKTIEALKKQLEEK